MDDLIAASIKQATQDADQQSEWYKCIHHDESQPCELNPVPSQTPEITLTRKDVVSVLDNFEWKIEHFLRLKFNLWLDDLIILSFAKYFVKRSQAIDFVADSLWEPLRIAEAVKRWRTTDKARYIFLPVHHTTGHFALLLLHCPTQKCYYLDSADGAFTAAKRAEIQNLLNSWEVPYTFEPLTVRAQSNAVDCGLHVISFVRTAVLSEATLPSFEVICKRDELFNLAFDSLATQYKNQLQTIVDRFAQSDFQILLSVTNKEELRSLSLQLVDECMPLTNIRTITTSHNLLAVKCLSPHYKMVFFNSIYSSTIKWQQSYNEFRGGGFAQPKLYAAFSKDMVNLRYYVPHTNQGNPLLVYEAQPYSDLVALPIFEQLLTSMGYTGFNYVTVLMYIGDRSHISAHRDEEQIDGFDTFNDIIATFVFGAKRELKLYYDFNEGKRKSVRVPNTDNSLYIMQGIQSITEHKKAAASGISYSVIFRRLKPFRGTITEPNKFNEQVFVDWTKLQIPQAWTLTADTADLIAGSIIKLREFNKRRLHPTPMASLSQKQGRATSLVLYSDQNIISPCGGHIWFTGYNIVEQRNKALNNCLLSINKQSLSIPVYKRIPKKGRLFLGNFYVDRAITVAENMYFLLTKHE